MTLSLAVVSATDETPTISVPEPDTSRVKLEPRCRVCQNDGVRQKVNELLASGATYAMTRRALGDAAGDVTADSIRRHAERHFPVQNAARATYLEILERRAQEDSVPWRTWRPSWSRATRSWSIRTARSMSRPVCRRPVDSKR
jgi:hypothetical protein